MYAKTEAPVVDTLKYWSGVITYRQTRIRIISVRRSRKKEILLYENQ